MSVKLLRMDRYPLTTHTGLFEYNLYPNFKYTTTSNKLYQVMIASFYICNSVYYVTDFWSKWRINIGKVSKQCHQFNTKCT